MTVKPYTCCHYWSHDHRHPYTSGPGGGRGIHRVSPKKRRVEGESTGVEYRAKKAGGDIKRKGRPDPYAYFPLNRQKLNRRSVD